MIRIGMRGEVSKAFSDTARRSWGTADGSGEPLTMSFDRYYQRAQAYPGAQWVELHFPSLDAKYGGMDWRSLWLVFERDGDEWRLTGIAHGSWTI